LNLLHIQSEYRRHTHSVLFDTDVKNARDLNRIGVIERLSIWRNRAADKLLDLRNLVVVIGRQSGQIKAAHILVAVAIRQRLPHLAEEGDMRAVEFSDRLGNIGVYAVDLIEGEVAEGCDVDWAGTES